MGVCGQDSGTSHIYYRTLHDAAIDVVDVGGVNLVSQRKLTSDPRTKGAADGGRCTEHATL